MIDIPTNDEVTTQEELKQRELSVETSGYMTLKIEIDCNKKVMNLR